MSGKGAAGYARLATSQVNPAQKGTQIAMAMTIPPQNGGCESCVGARWRIICTRPQRRPALERRAAFARRLRGGAGGAFTPSRGCTAPRLRLGGRARRAWRPRRVARRRPPPSRPIAMATPPNSSTSMPTRPISSIVPNIWSSARGAGSVCCGSGAGCGDSASGLPAMGPVRSRGPNADPSCARAPPGTTRASVTVVAATSLRVKRLWGLYAARVPLAHAPAGPTRTVRLIWSSFS